MTNNGGDSLRPTDRQIALFAAVEDIQELTNAHVVLLTDAYGSLVAISGDEDEVPAAIRAALSGKKLAAAGSTRELLSQIEVDGAWPVNVSIFGVPDTEHVLAILFGADADIMTVQQVGREASEMLAQILNAPL